MATASVPVRVDATGTPADGYRAGTPEPTSTKEITVQGPTSELEEVEYAYGTVDVSGRNSTFTSECSITLYNDAGESITGTHVTSQTDTVTVRVPIYPIESVPLTVNLTDGNTLTSEQVDVSISPPNVTLIGDQNTLAASPRSAWARSIWIPCAQALQSRWRFRCRTACGWTTPALDRAGDHFGQGRGERLDALGAGDDVCTHRHRAERNAVYGQHFDRLGRDRAARQRESALNEVDVGNLSIGLTFDSVSLGVGTHTVRGVIAATGLPAGRDAGRGGR